MSVFMPTSMYTEHDHIVKDMERRCSLAFLPPSCVNVLHHACVDKTVLLWDDDQHSEKLRSSVAVQFSLVLMCRDDERAERAGTRGILGSRIDMAG